jgi:hypothetical protein
MIQQVFLDLPGLSVSAGAVARQIQRMGDCLEGQYERLKVLVHNSPAVHMDETSWRVNGQNHWLWAMLSDKQTVYHIDKSRSGQVARNLLGEGFTGTLVSDFYGAYSGIDCPQQKCLVHLLRELKETAEAAPAFAQGIFHRRCRRLAQEMLRLKKKKEKSRPTASRDEFAGWNVAWRNWRGSPPVAGPSRRPGVWPNGSRATRKSSRTSCGTTRSMAPTMPPNGP